MKLTFTLIFLTSLFALFGCDKAPEQTATPVAETTSSAPAEAADTQSQDNLLDKAKDLSQETWDKTKEATGETVSAVSEKSQELYESAKEQAVETGSDIKEKVEEMGEAISEKSSETYESAKEKGSDVVNQAISNE